MRKAFGSTVLLWIIPTVALVANAARARGVPLAFLDHSGMRTMLASPWEPWAVLGLAAVTMLLVAHGPADPIRRGRVIGWGLGLLGVACYIALDAPLAFALVGTARLVHGPRSSGRPLGGPQLDGRGGA